MSDIYDAVPNLYQEGRVDYDLALSIDGRFDLRQINADSLLAEAKSWGILSDSVIATTITSTIDGFGDALEAVTPPPEAQSLMLDQLAWQHQQLAAGAPIGKLKRTAIVRPNQPQPRQPRGTRRGGRYAPRPRRDGPDLA